MGWFGKNKLNQSKPVLQFETGKDFIDYHCEYMSTQIQQGSPLAAEVVDARKQLGASVALKVDDNGIQTATLRVASKDGGFLVIAQTASANGDALHVGDVVAWIPAEHMANLAEAADDKRFGWVGLIVAKIAPEIDMNTQQMTALSNY